MLSSTIYYVVGWYLTRCSCVLMICPPLHHDVVSCQPLSLLYREPGSQNRCRWNIVFGTGRKAAKKHRTGSSPKIVAEVFDHLPSSDNAYRDCRSSLEFIVSWDFIRSRYLVNVIGLESYFPTSGNVAANGLYLTRYYRMPRWWN
jgi:hypothetical protein